MEVYTRIEIAIWQEICITKDSLVCHMHIKKRWWIERETETVVSSLENNKRKKKMKRNAITLKMTRKEFCEKLLFMYT